MCSVAGVQTLAWAHSPTKELLLIIPMHVMNKEIIQVSFINCDHCCCMMKINDFAQVIELKKDLGKT